MSIFKRIFPLIAIVLFTSSAIASDILVNTSINSAQTPQGGWEYEIDSMNVLWTDNGDITIDVYTNFGDYNNRFGSGGLGNIVFGDLLIGTSGLEDDYDYAFQLTDGRYDDFYTVDYTSNVGNLYEISSTQTAKEFHGQGANVQNGAVIGIANGDSKSQGNWSVDNEYKDIGYDKISFNFNVGGISAFQNSNQLSLSWAMTCANDMVHGVVKKASSGAKGIPEPTTILLFLLALSIITTQRKVSK